MKTFLTFLAVIFTSVSLYSQSPEKISYQAVIRNSNKTLIANQSVGLRISIIQGLDQETIVYSETHSPTTNSNGLLTIQIGMGVTAQSIGVIDWSNGPYFIQTEVDVEGGSNYSIIGMSEIISVPYALYAKTADSLSDGISSVEIAELIAKVEDLRNMTLELQAQLGVSDVDGNFYETVKIGDQVWMASNLKTTSYNDGSPIPLVIHDSEWAELTAPGFCWYNNDSVKYEFYGAYYNWYSVETGKLCPTGWSVPTDEDWTELEDYLAFNGYNYDGTIGGEVSKIGKALASNSGWWSSYVTGTVGNIDYPEYRNKSGFNAYPGGFRSYNGSFYSMGNHGYWWSSTEDSNDEAWRRYLSSDSEELRRRARDKNFGFTIRCIRY